MGGSLTNFRKLRRSRAFKLNNNFFFKLSSMRFLPGLVFMFDLNVSKACLVECSNLAIPSSALVNVNSFLFSLLTYPIVANNQSAELVYFFIFLLKDSVSRGRQKELLKLFRIL